MQPSNLSLLHNTAYRLPHFGRDAPIGMREENRMGLPFALKSTVNYEEHLNVNSTLNWVLPTIIKIISHSESGPYCSIFSVPDWVGRSFQLFPRGRKSG